MSSTLIVVLVLMLVMPFALKVSERLFRARAEYGDHALLDAGGAIHLFAFRGSLGFFEPEELPFITKCILEDRDALVQATGQPLALTKSVGAGYLVLPPEGEPPAVKILADWIRGQQWGANVEGLDESLGAMLKAGDFHDLGSIYKTLGFELYVVVIGPLSNRYSQFLDAKLKEEFKHYCGFITFASARSVKSIAKGLYIGAELQMQL
jgi:hypothetical protein